MNVERPTDGATVGEMRVEFGGGFVDGLLRAAAQLELAAGLKRDAADGAEISQPDRIFFVVEIVPASTGLDACEQGMNAVPALVLHGRQRILAIDVLFVLGADAPFGFRLSAARHDVDHVGPRLDQRREFSAGHEDSREA